MSMIHKFKVNDLVWCEYKQTISRVDSIVFRDHPHGTGDYSDLL